MKDINNVVMFQFLNLEQSRTLSFINNDFQVYGTIMKSPHPLNLTVSNALFIDYYNMDGGFIFETTCDDKMSLIGEVVFEQLSFQNQNPDLEKFKTGQFIKSSLPMNFTVKDSIFVLDHNFEEEIDVFWFEDTGLWAPDDGIYQFVRFQNNTLTFNDHNETRNDIYNNFDVSMVDANKRYKEIFCINNTFHNMLFSQYPFMQIEFYTTGVVNVIGNTFYNWSSDIRDMIEIEANDIIYLEDNTFDSCVSLTENFIWTETARIVNITGLTIRNTIKGDTALAGSLLDITTNNLGSCYIQNSHFESNFIRSSIIRIDQTVGEFDFINNTVTNEIIKSSANYIIVEGPYDLKIIGCVFSNIADDETDLQLTQLFSFESINLGIVDDIEMHDIQITNTSVSFFTFNTMSGITPVPKEIIFEDVMIENSYFKTRNPIINLGPFITDQDVQLIIRNFTFDGIIFEDVANLIYISWQSPIPIVIESSTFRNNQNGFILLQPVTTAEGSYKVEVNLFFFIKV